MFWTVFYLVGVVLSWWMLIKFHNDWIKEHPEDVSKPVEWGYCVVGSLLSWIAVVNLLLAKMASFNQLDWEEETQEELDEYMAKPESRVELSKEERIRIMHKNEFQAAQKEAMKCVRE